VVEDPADGGHAWFDLELGIMVNQERVPLLPVLVQLIRNAPLDFNPKTIATHDGEDQMLATLPDGSRVALPWGRVKPILSTLGELYFSDKIKTSLRMATLDAARLDELQRNVELKWTGGEELRDMGARLNQFGAVKRVATPAGLQATCATTRPTVCRGCNSCANTALPASWPMTWAWARPCRPWPTSWWKKKLAA
jgi:hypothetical protein